MFLKSEKEKQRVKNSIIQKSELTLAHVSKLRYRRKYILVFN